LAVVLAVLLGRQVRQPFFRCWRPISGGIVTARCDVERQFEARPCHAAVRVMRAKLLDLFVAPRQKPVALGSRGSPRKSK
jgi:hypothetical protein